MRRSSTRLFGIAIAGIIASCGGGGGNGTGDASFDADVDADLGDGGFGDAGSDAGDAGQLPARPTAPIGTLPTSPLCSECHGDATSAAPPLDLGGLTDSAERGVGAHRNHLRSSSWHHEVSCEDCHLVPVNVDDPGHIDTPWPAELTWSPLASGRGAAPTFDGTSCSDVYCHGSRLLPGGINTTPVWNVVDGSQAYCGTCHSIPPNAPHPQYDRCSTCHPTIDAGGSIIEPDRHVDGVLDLDISGLTCTSCHGSEADGNPAPPRDTANRTDTAELTVGAHRSHLGASDWHREVQCTDCHIVPSTVLATGHIDTPRPAELTWGGVAIADGASPSMTGTTCSGVYCHGETLLPGGTNTTPNWVTVDGTQAACGTCHSTPPGGTHPASTSCETCHPTMGPGMTIVEPARHIDGIVDLLPGGLTCTSCHGSAVDGTPAPPRDTAGNVATSAEGVGAHRSHLGTSDWHREVVCTDCHLVPSAVGDVGHIDSALPAELTWGAIATADLASPSMTGTTCSGVYCHGSTLLPGGTNTTPDWVTVDGTQAACGTCHSTPPRGGHTTSTNCAACHPTMGPGLTIVDAARHINGVVDLDLSGATCTDCHGSAADGTPAPPRDTRGRVGTSVRGVGAHRSHLGPSGWHKEVVCTDCHIVPATVTAPGHIDTAWPAELTWSALATANGATPTFNGTTCSGAYCHGTTLLPGGTNTTPNWRTVDGTQAACGTCHSTPPRGTHPRNNNCMVCHPTMGPGMTITSPARHINGVVDLDLAGVSCTDCHGSAADGTPAPPQDTRGRVGTGNRGVGAHRSHLGASGWHKEVVCTDCHVVPATVTAVGHIDTALPAELTFGALANADGAAPAMTGMTCNGVYCHGETLLPGGTNTTPTWTTVDGTQAACGTCHSTPPMGAHPRNTNCSVCHPTMAPGMVIADPARHINGVVDLDLSAVSCTDCHGSVADGTPAPPQDASGNVATTVRGVGAHRSHLGPSGWHKEVICTDCHIVPATVTAVGHLDTPRPAEVTWGPLATANGAAPSMTGMTCNGVYCHGETLQPGGTNTTPTWTLVDGTQAACGTCHGLPPGGTHVTSTDCAMCHPTINSGGTIIQPANHINGVVEIISNHPVGWVDPTSHGMTANNTGLANCQACHGANLQGGAVGVSCESCHPGWQTNCTFCHGGTDNMTGAPPAAVNGNTGRNTIAVGAHTEHVGSTSMHVAWDCTRCHNPKPTSALSPGHIDGDGRAEVIFDTLNPSATYDPVTGVCANLYCHGNGSSRVGTADWNTNPTLQCDSCHAYMNSPAADLRAMSGQHDRHVRRNRIRCNECHNTVVDSAGNIIGLPLHVNGQRNVSLRRGGRYTPGTPPSCNPACHGGEVWL